jgi:hypothetical protein
VNLVPAVFHVGNIDAGYGNMPTDHVTRKDILRKAFANLLADCVGLGHTVFANGLKYEVAVLARPVLIVEKIRKLRIYSQSDMKIAIRLLTGVGDRTRYGDTRLNHAKTIFRALESASIDVLPQTVIARNQRRTYWRTRSGRPGHPSPFGASEINENDNEEPEYDQPDRTSRAVLS